MDTINLMRDMRRAIETNSITIFSENTVRELTQQIQTQIENGTTDMAFEKEFIALLYRLHLINKCGHNVFQTSETPLTILLRFELELLFFRWLDRSITTPATLPKNGQEFLRVLKHTLETHLCNNHILFDYLEDQADATEFDLFFIADSITNNQFDDYIAMAQVGAPPRAKMELAKNYWDEMGHGSDVKIHSVMFDKLLAYRELHPSLADVERISPFSLSQANLFFSCSQNKQMFSQMIGVLAAGEYLVPKRYKKIVNGARRLGFSDNAMEFYSEHVTTDILHSDDWWNNVVAPMVDENPEHSTNIFKGALYRAHLVAKLATFLYNHLPSRNVRR